MLLSWIPGIETIGIIMQNSMLVLGVVSLYIGIILFFERKVNYKLLASIYVTFLILLIYFRDATLQKKDGKTYHGMTSATTINIHGTPQIVSVTHDMSDRKTVEENLRSMPIIDELTCLYKVHKRYLWP